MIFKYKVKVKLVEAKIPNDCNLEHVFLHCPLWWGFTHWFKHQPMTGLQDNSGNPEQSAYSEMVTCTDAAECVTKAKRTP